MKDEMRRLQEWFYGRCDGDWEHRTAVSIVTTDNPGWFVQIDIRETPWAEKDFKLVKQYPESELDWLTCYVKKGLFEGACGPMRLGDLIEVFLSWTEATDDSG